MIHTSSSRFVSGQTDVTVVNVSTGDSELAFDGDIAFGVEEQLSVSIDPSLMQAMWIYGDGKALTIATNDSEGGSPTDLISVAAGYALVWSANSGATNPFTAPVTSIYITNEDGAETAAVKVRILLQVNP